MDSARREQDGVAPVMPLVKQLEAAKTKEQLFAVQMEWAPYGEQEFFGAYIGADEKNATENILTGTPEYFARSSQSDCLKPRKRMPS